MFLRVSKWVLILMLAGSYLGMAACGVKPGSVKPPSGSQDDGTFPRTYPDLDTDPQ